ncbi:MAG: exopolysaccharide biosynthesis polyprenyl glycosylphosphotransferase [Imperialibacter sp.]
MPKRFYKLFPALFIFGELVIISIPFLLSYYIINNNLELAPVYRWAFGFYLGIWLSVSVVAEDFKIGRSTNYYVTLKRAFFTLFISLSLISFFWVLFEAYELSREFLVLIFIQLFVAVGFYRVLVHITLNKYRKFGGNVRSAIIIGFDQQGVRLYNLFKRKPEYGIRCVRFYDDAYSGLSQRDGIPILGGIDDFIRNGIDDTEFIYVSESVNRFALSQIVNVADAQLKKVKLIPQFNTELFKTYSLTRFDDISIVDINDLPLDGILNRVVKRTFDIVFSLFVVVFVLSWLYPILGLLIKLESSGPVFFRQLRHGKGNSPFVCYKFRTMVINNVADTKWASRNDPRITRVGTFLRRTSLDEIPQFLNVLIGNMSIVGPRPHPIPLNESYQNRVHKFTQRHASKPGITGLAQAMGYRGEIQKFHQMSSRVKLDRFYLQNWSFILDLKIIVLTVYSIVFNRENAY